MTKYKKYPWPTDGVTVRQLNRAVDRFERLYQNEKTRRLDLLDLIKQLEYEVAKLQKELGKTNLDHRLDGSVL